MGAVKEYLIGMIRRDLKEKGLCVWLDVRGEYSEFFRELKARGERGEFEHPALSFDGSFLELMIALAPRFSSKDNQPCLVYAPGLTQAAIRNTPLLEAYKAGKELQYNLKNLVRSACAGKLTPARLNHLLEEENFAWENAAPAEARSVLHDGLPFAVGTTVGVTRHAMQDRRERRR